MAWRLIFATVLLLPDASAFVPPGILRGHTHAQGVSVGRTAETLPVTFMAKGPSGGGKKKRRRRKQPPSTQQPTSTTPPAMDLENIGDGSSQPPATIEELRAIANFSQGNAAPSSSSIPEPTLTDVGGGADDQLVDLPDIRDTLKRKEMKIIEEETAQERKRPKISRRDTKAFIQLLEEEPFADANDDFFEDEAYGTVSALLAEGARPFLGIPPGPLQVGHFIGSLGIILCAFVEYPGFPLTNLPTPLRDALQGGLAIVYLINTVLAVLAVFAAAERGQSSFLWAAKSFSVGGLAFDQLTQLPTTAQIEEVQNRKGARAIKKKK